MVFLVSFIYLHGLLSSSHSKKAKRLSEDLRKLGKVHTPDFYPLQHEFEEMTVSSLLDKVSDWIKEIPGEIILIGSSFGGLVATRFVQLRTNKSKKIRKMILLAPALDYYKLLKERTSQTDWEAWQKNGYIEIKHPAWEGLTKLSWNFVCDLNENHMIMNEKIDIPTLIIHGSLDNIIPTKYLSNFIHRQFQAKNSIILEIITNGDHQLLEMYDKILMLIRKFV